MIWSRNPRDIAQVLRSAIVAREIEAGSTFTVDELAQELGAAASAVSRAFRILRDEGWVALEGNGRAVVRPMSHLSIAEASHL